MPDAAAAAISGQDPDVALGAACDLFVRALYAAVAIVAAALVTDPDDVA